jgi:hypothetical protein
MYPDLTPDTPSVMENTASTHQKQPPPTVAFVADEVLKGFSF